MCQPSGKSTFRNRKNNNSPVLFKYISVMKKKDYPRSCSRLMEAKEKLQLKATTEVIFRKKLLKRT